MIDRRAGGEFAGGLVAADELPHPFGADGVLAAECGEAEAGLEVGEDAGPEVERESTHSKLHRRSCNNLIPELNAQDGKSKCSSVEQLEEISLAILDAKTLCELGCFGESHLSE